MNCNLLILAKYISAWLLSEGALILSGMGYNGEWEDGSIKWNGGANVRLRIFEKSSRFQHIIDGFNINTNNSNNESRSRIQRDGKFYI